MPDWQKILTIASGSGRVVRVRIQSIRREDVFLRRIFVLDENWWIISLRDEQDREGANEDSRESRCKRSGEVLHVPGKKKTWRIGSDRIGSIDRRLMPIETFPGMRPSRLAVLFILLSLSLYLSVSFVCRNGLTNDVSAVTTGACAGWIQNEADVRSSDRLLPASSPVAPTCLSLPARFLQCTEWIIDRRGGRWRIHRFDAICHHFWNLTTRSPNPRIRERASCLFLIVEKRKKKTNVCTNEWINYRLRARWIDVVLIVWQNVR